MTDRNAELMSAFSTEQELQILREGNEAIRQLRAERDRLLALQAELVGALTGTIRQLEILLPTEGRVHDERQALIAAYVTLAKAKS